MGFLRGGWVVSAFLFSGVYFHGDRVESAGCEDLSYLMDFGPQCAFGHLRGCEQFDGNPAVAFHGADFHTGVTSFGQGGVQPGLAGASAHPDIGQSHRAVIYNGHGNPSARGWAWVCVVRGDASYEWMDAGTDHHRAVGTEDQRRERFLG